MSCVIEKYSESLQKRLIEQIIYHKEITGEELPHIVMSRFDFDILRSNKMFMHRNCSANNQAFLGKFHGVPISVIKDGKVNI